jgi:hypothetical protein
MQEQINSSQSIHNWMASERLYEEYLLGLRKLSTI